jgi:uncharacterized protein HemX
MTPNPFKYLSGFLLVALIALGVGSWVLYQSQELVIKSQAEKITDLLESNSVLQVSNANLERAIKEQNKKVEEFLEEAKARKKASDAALAKARAESRKWKKRLDDILNSPKPAADDCDAMTIRLNQYYETVGTP